MSTRPTVYIARQRVADGWTGRTDGRLAAIASIRIPWGRSRITEPPAGHVATIKLLDTETGHRRFEYETLLGMHLEVRRTGDGLDVPLLVGTIAGHSARRVRVRHPVTGAHVDRVELTVSVSDTIAVLSQRVRTGPYNGMQIYGTGGIPAYKTAGAWGYGGWPAQYARDRLDAIAPHIRDLVPEVVMPRLSFTTPTGDPDAVSTSAAARPAVEGHHRHDLPDLWALLVGAYASSDALSYPRIIPGVRVEPGGPATSTFRQLRTGPDASYPMRQAFGSPITGAGAWRFGLDRDDVYPSADITDRIAHLSVPISQHKYSWQKGLTDTSTGQEIRPDELLDDDSSSTLDQPINAGGAASETLTLDAAHLTASSIVPRSTASENPYLSSSTAHQGAWNAGVALRNAIGETLEQLNNWLTLPDLHYRSWDSANSNELSAALQTWETGAIALQASIWHKLGRAPRTVQFIGGTLEWEPRGWHHVITPAPTIDTHRRDLTIGELFAADNPISSFATNIFMSDLPAFTERSALT